MNAPLFLRIPIAVMDAMRSPLSFDGFTPEEARQFLDPYDDAEKDGIRQALEFAERTPGHDFVDMVPGIKYSNQQIHRFLRTLKDSLFP